MINYDLASLPYDDYVDVMNRALVQKIISTDNFLKIKTLFEVLPGKTTNAVGIEFYPQKSHAGCDISISIDPEIDKKEVLFWSGKDPIVATFDTMEILDVVDVQAIALNWVNSKRNLSKVLKEIILEMDVSSSINNKIPLNIFLTLVPGNDLDSISRIIRQDVFEMISRKNSFDITKCLGQLSSLPAESNITHIGFMLGRPEKLIRVLIRCNPSNIADILKSLRIVATHSFLDKFVKILKTRCEHVVLALNLTESKTTSSFGIECGWTGGFETDSYEWWIDFIKDLELIECWKKHTKEIFKILDINQINKIDAGTPQGPGINWGLNHIKGTFALENDPELKWYMYMHGVKSASSIY